MLPEGRRVLGCTYFIVSFVILGSTMVSAQLTQGYDVEEPGPGDWTKTIIDTTLSSTVTFKLNPCEVVLYFDDFGAPKSCLPRPVSCGTIGAMENKLLDALNEWDRLDPAALTFAVERLEDPCTGAANCGLYPDFWEDDTDWVVTRTYIPDTEQFTEQSCPGAATPPRKDGGGLRLYYDDTGDSAGCGSAIWSSRHSGGTTRIQTAPNLSTSVPKRGRWPWLTKLGTASDSGTPI